MNHAIRGHAHSQRPPACRCDLRAREIASATVTTNTDRCVIVLFARLSLVLKLNEHPWPVDLVAHFSFGAFEDSDADFLVDHGGRLQSQAEAKVGTGAIFPFVDRWQIDTRGDRWDFGNVDFSLQSVLNVGDKIILPHLAAWSTGDAGEFRTQEQRPGASRKSIPRGRNTLDDIGMASLDPFIPTSVRTSPHRATLVFVNVLGTLGVPGNVVPV